MARKRMIDPNIWESEDFSKLSVFARFLFIGMFSNADDEGRGRAKPVYLKSVIFPYDEHIRMTDMEKALKEIAERMSVVFYEHGGNQYYELTHWKKWQRVEKPQKSLIPPPSKENASALASENPAFQKKEDSATVLRRLPEDSGLKEKKKSEEKLREKKEKELFTPVGYTDALDFFQKFVSEEPLNIYQQEWLQSKIRMKGEQLSLKIMLEMLEAEEYTMDDFLKRAGFRS